MGDMMSEQRTDAGKAIKKTMLFAEAVARPWVADSSLAFFFSHLADLKPPTWMFVIVGTLMAFWFGRGR